MRPLAFAPPPPDRHGFCPQELQDHFRALYHSRYFIFFNNRLLEMEGIDQELAKVFEELNLVQQTHQHEAAFTVEEQAVHVGHLPGALTKNLFLRDKKYGLFLVTALSTKEVNMKTVASLLGLSGANLRLGDEDLLRETLNVTRGSVSPLALVHDKSNAVKFCIDKALTTQEVLNVHPLRNDRTTSVSFTELSRFLERIQHVPTVLD
ncbi:prolyl-tRNA synthetase associated domain-containing protein, partial [archaeon]